MVDHNRIDLQETLPDKDRRHLGHIFGVFRAVVIPMKLLPECFINK